MIEINRVATFGIQPLYHNLVTLDVMNLEFMLFCVRNKEEVCWLAGVDDVWERHQNLGAALAGVPPGEPVLLLVHEPDFDEAARAPHRIVVQLSGHSHGGRVNLPLLGRPILPPLGKVYPAGLQPVPGSDLGVYQPGHRRHCTAAAL
jgi:predicted MPP superfamily phosphohydrolase